MIFGICLTENISVVIWLEFKWLTTWQLYVLGSLDKKILRAYPGEGKDQLHNQLLYNCNRRSNFKMFSLSDLVDYSVLLICFTSDFCFNPCFFLLKRLLVSGKILLLSAPLEHVSLVWGKKSILNFCILLYRIKEELS